MADVFQLSVLTPVREVFSGEVSTVTVSGHDGDFGVLPGHVAYITSVQPGALVIEGTGGKQVLAIGDGFAQVAASKVSIIVSSAVDASDLDAAQVASDLAEASNALLQYGPSDAEHKNARYDQAMALGKLRAVEAR
ncbi:MAG: ATP synthase F1 subunit epsilon [Deltaproteobacteria bacterium]|nr:ATP synthase F1 subunit epsilon [Deltaproteobacteria bacterium]